MKYHIITLGCPKNSVDSEGMDSILSAQGHAPVAEIQDADLVIVNTCSFIAAARDETLQVLREIGQNKKTQPAFDRGRLYGAEPRRYRQRGARR